MKLYIKNMVCGRCKMAVKSELIKFGLHPLAVQLGEVEIQEQLTEQNKNMLNQNLLSFGFELIDDKKGRVIEKIKNTIVEIIHYPEDKLKMNFSKHLSQKLHHEYSYLSNLFSETEGITIEKYFILQKIEKVKELLMYDELSLTEIAIKLNYSSVGHLSYQFKKITGLTPSFFKSMKTKERKQIEDL